MQVFISTSLQFSGVSRKFKKKPTKIRRISRVKPQFSLVQTQLLYGGKYRTDLFG